MKGGTKLGSSHAQVFISTAALSRSACVEHRAEPDRAAPVVRHERHVA